MAHLYHLSNPDQTIDIDRIESIRVETYQGEKFYCAVSISGHEYWLYDYEYNDIKRLWTNMK